MDLLVYRMYTINGSEPSPTSVSFGSNSFHWKVNWSKYSWIVRGLEVSFADGEGSGSEGGMVPGAGGCGGGPFPGAIGVALGGP